VYFDVFLIKFTSADVILDLSCSLIAQVPHPCNKVGNAKVFYIFSLCVFGIERGLSSVYNSAVLINVIIIINIALRGDNIPAVFTL